MPDGAFSISSSDELLYIYITLRKLRCIHVKTTDGDKKAIPLETSLFRRRFLLKQLDERLEDLDAMAAEICSDLFTQVGGRPKKASHNNQQAIDVHNSVAKYPEFDEYFHFCVHQLHDFMIGLHWHEVDIEKLSKHDRDYVSKHLTFVDYFLSFQQAFVNLIKQADKVKPPSSVGNKKGSPGRKATAGSPKTDQSGPDGKKSNLRESPGRSSSPQARRRVRFKDLPDEQGANSNDNQELYIQRDDFADNHSVFALDLLIYSINIYIQRLADTLIAWSAGVQNELNQLIDLISDSKVKVRTQQMQVIAKKIKIYNDVHLTVLDHLDEIKRHYLIRHIQGTLLSRDSPKLLWTYKTPRISLYAQRIGLDVEIKILVRLVKQCLQIFFNLIVCEINFDPIQLSEPKAAIKQEKVRSQENVNNFIANWLKIDDVVFGQFRVRKPPSSSGPETDRLHADILVKQIRWPQLVAKTSTLSLSDRYTSSSHILSHMDNLVEFMREFLQMISGRLANQQHLRYFLEAISIGLVKFFDVVAPKLEQQLKEIKSKTRPNRAPTGQTAQRKDNQRALPNVPMSADFLVAKIRCLKFVHVINLADKIVANEAARMKIELSGCDLDLDLKLSNFTQLCMDQKQAIKKMFESVPR
jgi:hypothetical protein